MDQDRPGASENNAEHVEKAIKMLQIGMMPPPGLPRPDNATAKAFAKTLAAGIDRAAEARPSAGSPDLHRLNRTEYQNSIRDLLGLDVEVSTLLPADDMSHGFDNMADALTVSPALMEGYIRAAGKISRLAVGDSHVTPTTATFQVPKIVNQMRLVDGAPYGTRGGVSTIYNFPADGEYVFKTSFYHDLDGPFWGKNQGKGEQLEISINGTRVALLTLDPNMMPTDTRQTPPIAVKAGPQRVSAAFLEKSSGPIEDIVSPVEMTLIDTTHADIPGLTSLPHLRELNVTGPTNVTGVGDTPSRRTIFTCHPEAGADEVPCAKKVIARLARLAYRRPATDSDIEDLLSLFQKGRNQGNFDSGIQAVVQTILSDPEFVFRVERVPRNLAGGASYRISDLELASRLSFFLWSSAPDDALINLASQNQLHEPATLEQQVRRMLADPKSEALATVFAAQWLHLQNLKDVQPDVFLFPNYDRNLGDSMRRETELFFSSIVHEDRSVLDLLGANYTFVDEILAKHYGIPDILGSRFRRVAITDERRFGLLGQASILTLTSVSNRTSPVARGKYVMQVLLGEPPPPPPPNVPALKENDESSKAQSVREKMEMHRKQEPCHSCHQLMDPIGLALENFDGVGQWRTNDTGIRIDPTSQMFEGSKLDGPVSLRKAILSRPEGFLNTFTENFLAYGLGRVIDYRDLPAARVIERDAAANGNRFSVYVLGIVKSTPFQMRHVEVAEPPATSESQQEFANRSPMTFITKKHLSRRTMLRGMGVAIGLPFLDAMVPAQTVLTKTAAAPKTRLACIEMVHGSAGATVDGSAKHYWSPEKDGHDFEFTQTLEPLEKYRDYITIVSDTDLHPAGAFFGIRRRRRPFPFERGLSDRRARQDDRRRRHPMRHIYRSDVRAAVRPGYAAAVAAVVHRKPIFIGLLRLRLRLRVFRYDLLGLADPAAADDHRSAHGIRKPVRRRFDPRRTRLAPADERQHSRPHHASRRGDSE